MRVFLTSLESSVKMVLGLEGPVHSKMFYYMHRGSQGGQQVQLKGKLHLVWDIKLVIFIGENIMACKSQSHLAVHLKSILVQKSKFKAR